MKKAKFLILAGEGINCERETEKAIVSCGGEAKIVLCNQLIKEKSLLTNSQGLVIPGGFSFGDELGSGQVLALKIKGFLQDELQQFILDKKPLLGICNGMQVLAKLGLLPFPSDFFEIKKEDRSLSMASNSQGHFIDRWAKIQMTASHCHWIKWADQEAQMAFEQYPYLPIRHGEGRFLFKDENVLRRVKEENLEVLHYEQDQNGSQNKIAALTDATGLILGMMPHPEAAMHMLLTPSAYKKGPGPGVLFFNSIFCYLKNI